MRSSRFWVIILGGVLVVSLAASFALGLTPAERGLVYLDGVLVERFDLTGFSYRSFMVEGESGYNVIEVEDGRVRVSDADCPNGYCVRQGWVTGGAVPIVCLPNRLLIRFDGGSLPDIDAVTSRVFH